MSRFIPAAPRILAAEGGGPGANFLAKHDDMCRQPMGREDRAGAVPAEAGFSAAAQARQKCPRSNGE
jgi:hypothetical protein